MVNLDKKKLLNFLRDKRVILVGPGGILHNKGLGNFIDSFDVVVRVNSLPYPKSLENDLGARTDIYYTGHFPWTRQMDDETIVVDKDFNSKQEKDFSILETSDGRKNALEIYKKHGVKFYIFTIPLECKISHHHYKEQIEKFSNLVNFPIFYACQENFNLIYDEKAKIGRPNSGFCTILDLLHYPLKELCIAGVDFFRSSYLNVHRHGGDFDFRKDLMDPIKRDDWAHDLHYPDRQFFAFKNCILKKDSRVSVLENAKHFFEESVYEEILDFKEMRLEGKDEEIEEIKKAISKIPELIRFK